MKNGFGWFLIGGVCITVSEEAMNLVGHVKLSKGRPGPGPMKSSQIAQIYLLHFLSPGPAVVTHLVRPSKVTTPCVWRRVYSLTNAALWVEPNPVYSPIQYNAAAVFNQEGGPK